jgi:hypothetical protein
MIHIPAALIFSMLGAFQFSAGFRRARPRWHRLAGRVLVPCGLLAALSGLWMTLFSALPPKDGDLFNTFRLVFGTAMIACLLLGLAAVLRRDFAAHRGWMMRGYAIGVGAGTQAFTSLAGYLVSGPPTVQERGVLMGAAWVINLAVAEYIIRKQSVQRLTTRLVS